MTEEAYNANALYSLQKLKVKPPTIARESKDAFEKIYDNQQRKWLDIPRGLWQPVDLHRNSGTNGDELEALNWFDTAGVYRSFPLFNRTALPGAILRYLRAWEENC